MLGSCTATCLEQPAERCHPGQAPSLVAQRL